MIGLNRASTLGLTELEQTDMPVVAMDRDTGLVLHVFMCPGDGELVMDDITEQQIIDQCNGEGILSRYNWKWAIDVDVIDAEAS